MVVLSVLLLTKNGSRDLESVLPAVYSQRGIPQFEVIAIDSGSTDGTIDTLRRFPVRVEKIPAETFHHARTRNLAASLARGEILVFLSQDAIPSCSEWLDAMLSNFTDREVGAAYGRQLPKSGSSLEREATLDATYGDQRIVKDPSHRNGLGYKFYHFSNVNAAIRRSVWAATQFPEDLNVFEDVGIAKRILDAGWKIVYDPDASVIHSHHHNTVGLFRRYFDIGYTLKRLEIWDAPGTRSSMLRDFHKLLRKPLAQIKDSGTRHRVPAAVGQNLAKSAGLLLGLNQRYLPLGLKRRLSAHRVFG